MRKAASGLVMAALGLMLAIGGVGRALAQGAPRTHSVIMENMKFTPSTVEISPGDRVTFKNRDLVPHTATTKGTSSSAFDSGVVKPGESWTVTPQSGEAIRYGCIFHPTMEGVIIVTHH